MNDAGLRRLLERATAQPPADLEARVFRARRHPWRWTAAAAAVVLVAGAVGWSLGQSPGQRARADVVDVELRRVVPALLQADANLGLYSSNEIERRSQAQSVVDGIALEREGGPEARISRAIAAVWTGPMVEERKVELETLARSILDDPPVILGGPYRFELIDWIGSKPSGTTSVAKLTGRFFSGKEMRYDVTLSRVDGGWRIADLARDCLGKLCYT
jgi:hypothetical protein